MFSFSMRSECDYYYLESVKQKEKSKVLLQIQVWTFRAWIRGEVKGFTFQAWLQVTATCSDDGIRQTDAVCCLAAIKPLYSSLKG